MIMAGNEQIRFRTMPDHVPPERWRTLFHTHLAHYLTATGRPRIYAMAVLTELLAMRARRKAEAQS